MGRKKQNSDGKLHGVQTQTHGSLKKRQTSAKSLTQLYTVIIGVALSMAVRTAITPEMGISDVSGETISLFVAFVATLVPFYHGALRHIDDAYVENEQELSKTSALIFDFVLLFFHGIAFVVLSLLISKPQQFCWAMMSVLAIDVVWGVFVQFSTASKNNSGAEGKWALINFFFVVASFIYFTSNNISIFDAHYPPALPILATGMCVLRTTVDYYLCREFYFPEG